METRASNRPRVRERHGDEPRLGENDSKVAKLLGEVRTSLVKENLGTQARDEVCVCVCWRCGRMTGGEIRALTTKTMTTADGGRGGTGSLGGGSKEERGAVRGGSRDSL